jgi:membrane peptidoglycan carboxypeptidase
MPPPGQGGRPPMNRPPMPPNGPGRPMPMAPGNPVASNETEMLPLVMEDEYLDHELPAEPGLLTHHDGELDRDNYDSYEHDAFFEEEDAADPDAPTEEELKKAKRKKIWRRVRRTGYVLAGLSMIAPIIMFFVMYQTVTVPDPKSVIAALDQPYTIYYSDGSVMQNVASGSGNRQLVTYDQVPDVVKHAVMAAEDATFETNSGFDVKGIFRAVWISVTGGSSGGSTISQQYIKNASGQNQRSITRKFTELVKAYKLNRTQSKNDILTGYLNIVYFGRGAYGIQAASKAYYGKELKDLTKNEAATLAGMIQSPNSWTSATYVHRRWDYVTGQMIQKGWMTDAEKATQQGKAPVFIDYTSASGSTNLAGKEYLYWVVKEVKDELAAQNLTEDQLKQTGAKIYTTIDPKAEEMAVASQQKVMSANDGTSYTTTSSTGKPIDHTLASAQVSIDPSTGGIVAYYGGAGIKTWGYDLASQPHPPGSSFKPLVFMSAMQNNSNVGLGSTYDSTSGQTILGQPIANADGETCSDVKNCTVKEGMTKSVNTVFALMASQNGTSKVRDTAWEAGIAKQLPSGTCGEQPTLIAIDPTTCKPGSVDIGISIGQYAVRPLDMAQAYATIANNGNLIPSHFVSKVTDTAGSSTLYQFTTQATPAFDKNDQTHNQQLARNVIESMTDVASHSYNALASNRPNAAKTGTSQAGKSGHNAHAWMVGFTPQIVTAVWVGNRGNDDSPIYGNYKNPVGSKKKHYDIYGREEPAYIWSDFMDNYLANKPVVQFPALSVLGTAIPTSTVAPTTTTPSTTQPSTTAPTSTTSKTTTPTISSSSDTPSPTNTGGIGNPFTSTTPTTSRGKSSSPST